MCIRDRVFTTLPLLLTGEPLERKVVVDLRNHLREMNAECEDLMSSSMIHLTSAPDGGESVPEPIPYPGRRLAYGDRVNVLVNGFMPGGFASALGRTYIPVSYTHLSASGCCPGKIRICRQKGSVYGECTRTLVLISLFISALLSRLSLIHIYPPAA